MKKLTAMLLVATALISPTLAYGRDASLAIQMTSYRGPEAYLAVYLTRSDGSYDSTLYVAGRKGKYYRHLRGWIRGIINSYEHIDGITGASVGSGQTILVDISIADALVDAGYQIHVDSAVEEGASYRDDVVLDLTSAASGQATAGTGYIGTMTVTF